MIRPNLRGQTLEPDKKMYIRPILFIIPLAVVVVWVGTQPVDTTASAVTAEDGEKPAVQTEEIDLDQFKSTIKPFLTQYCQGCHGAKKQKAKFFLHDIDGQVTNRKDVERWEKILELVSLGDMPPPDEAQPTKAQREQLVQWISAELRKVERGQDPVTLALPKNGNRVSHEDLFSGEFKGPAYSSSRLWRRSPGIFNRFAADIMGLIDGFDRETLSQPFTDLGGNGIRDYDILKADEGTLNVMMLSAYHLSEVFVLGRRVASGDGNSKSGFKFHKPNTPHGRQFNTFNAFAKAEGKPTQEEIDKVMLAAFDVFFQREPTEQDLKHYRDDYLMSCLETGGREEGLRFFLMGMMMSVEFIYRAEIGLGEALPDGRRMLSPRELMYAVSYAVTDRPPTKELRQAVAEGKLSTKADVQRELRRMLAGEAGERYWNFIGRGSLHGSRSIKEVQSRFGRNERFERFRLLRFFREYFGYTNAPNVFKCESRNEGHAAFQLVFDADLMVLDVLNKDKDVFETLLTSNEYFVSYQSITHSKRHHEKVLENYSKFLAAEKAGGKNPYNIHPYEKNLLDQGLVPNPNWRYLLKYVGSYNLAPLSWSYPFEQPFPLPKDQRAGMLTHPAWLVAHSLNFETDPVRRGKWIQEKLLAGIVPDVPIGVDAKVPEDHTQTLRERFKLVEAEACWRCHKKMNPLGDPFEAYDDFGRFRTKEFIGDEEAYREKLKEYKQLKRRNKDLQPPVPTTKPVNSKTVIKHSGDPDLDGEYDNAIELVNALAKSDLARQSFLRHMFRYFMGRNETLDDSPTLMAMDKTYLESGGSFNETLITLLTSDSFLYRK